MEVADSVYVGSIQARPGKSDGGLPGKTEQSWRAHCGIRVLYGHPVQGDTSVETWPCLNMAMSPKDSTEVERASLNSLSVTMRKPGVVMRGQVLSVKVEEESDVPLTSNEGVDIVLRAETVGEG